MRLVTRIPLLSFLLLALSAAVLHASEAPKLLFDVPAGEAATTLRTFAQQAKREIVFPPVNGAQTKAVRGKLTVMEALQRMLADTGLVAIEDKKSGAIMVHRVVDDEKNAPSRLADAQAANRLTAENAAQEAERVRIKDGMVQLEDYTVTGSRIRGVLGEATVQPVFTYSRADLDRFGVQTFADLRRYIPQLPQTDWNTQLETAFMGSPETGTGAQGLTDFGAGLRNLGGTATLVLLDGRRLPKLGQRFATTAAYDLSGIPLSAVERIEVLTDGASAVYGADALAGVINIILKKEYRGTELAASYTNTFSTDTAERQVQLSHGFRRGGFSLTLSGTWAGTNSLSPRDRWWSATSDKRPWGGTDGRSDIPDRQGGVRSIDGSNLPGLNSPQAAIPVNSTGQGLTIADYANTPIPDRLDFAKYTDYGSRTTEAVRLSVSQEIKPWLEIFGSGVWNRSVSIGRSGSTAITRASLLSQRIILPAGYPGNPFGVPVYLERALWEFLALRDTDYAVTSHDFSAGFRGNVGAWRYELAATARQSDYNVTGRSISTGGVGNIYPLLQNSINSTNPASRILLLNDATFFTPHSPDFYREFMTSRDIGEVPDVMLYDFKADGPIWDLPAGPVQFAFGAEVQVDKANLGTVNNFQRLGGVFEREVLGVFAEMQIPLISEKQGIPLVHRMALNLSGRKDDDSDFAGKTVPRYGMFYHPTPWLALRASYGTGFKVPTLHQLYRVIQDTTVFTPVPVIDPQRNNEPFSVYRQISGGTLELLPEESTNINAGIVVEVPGIRGLSISIDYYDLKHRSRITAPSAQQMVDFFPGRVIRDTPTSADTVAGRPGRIIGLDVRAVNLSHAQAKGFDFEVRYHRALGDWGDIQVRLMGSKPTTMETRVTPTSSTIDQINFSPWRGTGMVYWSCGPWEAGAIATYAHDYLTTTNIVIDPVTLWDFQASYDFGKSSWKPQGWLRHVVGDTRLTAKVINAFDKEPQTRLGSSLGNVDPRGQRYQISLQRKF